MSQMTFLSEAPPAKISVSPESDLEWMRRVVTWPSNIFPLLADVAPAGWYGKMSPASFHHGAMTRTVSRELAQTEQGETFLKETISQPSSNMWGNAGMGSHGESLTVNISECHNVAAASYLSDILETGDLPQRFFLTAKACAGILRRAEKRGKELPKVLERALQMVIEAATPDS